MTATRRPVVLMFGVVNEVDVIRQFVEYHLQIGVDLLTGADLGSTDGTLDVLDEYERQGRVEVLRLERYDVRFEHRDFVNPLVARIRERHPEAWILFADADEFWVFPDGDAPAFLSALQTPVVYFRRCNMVPARLPSGTAADFSTFDLVVNRPLPFDYPMQFLVDRAGLDAITFETPAEILRGDPPKVAIRANVGGWVAPGYHHVIAPGADGPTVLERRGYIAHFPARSVEQWRKKAQMVSEYIARNPPEDDLFYGGHWGRLNAIHREGLVDADFDRQMLNAADIEKYLKQGVLRRDATLSSRLRAIAGRRVD